MYQRAAAFAYFVFNNRNQRSDSVVVNALTRAVFTCMKCLAPRLLFGRDVGIHSVQPSYCIIDIF